MSLPDDLDHLAEHLSDDHDGLPLGSKNTVLLAAKRLLEMAQQQAEIERLKLQVASCYSDFLLRTGNITLTGEELILSPDRPAGFIPAELRWLVDEGYAEFRDGRYFQTERYSAAQCERGKVYRKAALAK